MGSKKFSLDWDDARVIGMMFLVALAGAMITWLQDIETEVDWGLFSPFVSAAIVMLIGALRQFIKDNTIAKIILVVLALSPAAAFAGGHFLLADTPSDCTCDDTCECSLTQEICDCDHSETEYVSVQLPARNRQILMFTQAGCVPCARWEHTQKVPMLNAGWVFGDETDQTAHVRVIDDPDVADLYGVETFPTFICMENGLIVERFNEYTTATKLKGVYGVKRTYFDSGKDPNEPPDATSGGGGYNDFASDYSGNSDDHDGQLRVTTKSTSHSTQPGLTDRTYCGPSGCYTSVPRVRTYVTRGQSANNSQRNSRYLYRSFRTGSGCVSCRR